MIETYEIHQGIVKIDLDNVRGGWPKVTINGNPSERMNPRQCLNPECNEEYYILINTPFVCPFCANSKFKEIERFKKLKIAPPRIGKTISPKNILHTYKLFGDKFLTDIKIEQEKYDHPTQTGSVLEIKIREMLNQILPDNIGVTKGKMLDYLGRNSTEWDAILYRKDLTPKFYPVDTEVSRIFAEATGAVIEIKTNLNDLREAQIERQSQRFEKLQRVYVHNLIGRKIGLKMPTEIDEGVTFPKRIGVKESINDFIGKVPVIVFALKGVELEHLFSSNKAYLWEHIDYLIIPNKYCICVENKKPRILAEGDNSLPRFLAELSLLVAHWNEQLIVLKPELLHYYLPRETD